MVDPERLQSAGQRAYELGRWRVASLIALIVLPLGALCGWITGAGETCACLAILLLGLSVYLRWRGRGPGRSVAIGLAAGIPALAAALLLPYVLPSCVDVPLWSLCTASSLLIGVPTGVWVGLHAAHGHPGDSPWVGATAVALLTASMGCVGLGVPGILGLTVGLLAGSGGGMVWRAGRSGAA